MATKIAPYNNAMRLGQGFNSYTHRLCIDNAVKVKPVDFEAGDAQKQSQVVSYSSRFVSKLSEVVETMNISLSSAIKRGTVEISGNITVVDEDTFGAADLNAVVSVKVVNQTTIVKEDSEFTSLTGIKPQDERFNDIYGDCYISGFIYGGELTGIVSVKVHDRMNITGTTNRQDRLQLLISAANIE